MIELVEKKVSQVISYYALPSEKLLRLCYIISYYREKLMSCADIHSDKIQVKFDVLC